MKKGLIRYLPVAAIGVGLFTAALAALPASDAEDQPSQHQHNREIQKHEGQKNGTGQNRGKGQSNGTGQNSGPTQKAPVRDAPLDEDGTSDSGADPQQDEGGGAGGNNDQGHGNRGGGADGYNEQGYDSSDVNNA